MKTKLMLCAGAAAGLFMVVNEAAALPLACEFEDYYGGYSCRWSEMPSHNQRSTAIPDNWFPNGDHNKSALCAPTSAAMVAGALNNYDRIIPNSWIDKNISHMTWVTRIINFANKMGTSVTDGTDNSVDKIADRYVDVKNSGRAFTTSDNVAISVPYVRDRITWGQVQAISYGHYTRTCGTRPPLICSYRRSGGHVMAVNGTRVYSGTDYLIVYNPAGPVDEWSGAVVEDLTFLHPPAGTRDTRWYEVWPNPYPRAIYWGGSYYGIVEKFGGIDTN